MHRRNWTALILMGAAMAVVACSGDTDLPPFAVWQESGAAHVDLAEATDGAARFSEEEHAVLYSAGSEEQRFSYRSVSFARGISVGAMLENERFAISPVITPGDGIADMFAVPQIDGDEGELRVTLFLDDDWQNFVGGDLFLHTVQLGPTVGTRDGNVVRVEPEEGYLKTGMQQVDFADAVDGVWTKTLTFAAEDNPSGFRGSPSLALTNIPGSFDDVMRPFLNMQPSDPEHLVISFESGR